MCNSDSVLCYIDDIRRTLNRHISAKNGFIEEEDMTTVTALFAIAWELCENPMSSAEIDATIKELDALQDELEVEKKGLDEDYDELKADHHGLRTVLKAWRADHDEAAVDEQVWIMERNELVAEKLALIAKQGVLTRLHIKKIADLEEQLAEHQKRFEDISERREDLQNEFDDHVERLDEWDERWDHHERLRHHYQNRFDNFADRASELERQMYIAVYDRNDASSGFTVVPTVAGYTVFMTELGFSVVPAAAKLSTTSTSPKWKRFVCTMNFNFRMWLSDCLTTDGVTTTSLHVTIVPIRRRVNPPQSRNPP